MEDLALIVSSMFFGGILIGFAAIVMAILSNKRARLRSFAWALSAGSLLIGAWFATMNIPLAVGPLFGGLISLPIMLTQIFKSRRDS